MNQIAAVSVILQSEASIPKILSSGQMSRATFWDDLQYLHPTLFDGLNKTYPNLKPFTASRLIRIQSDRKDDNHLFRLRYTTLEPHLSAIMLNSLIPLWLSDGLKICDDVTQVIDVQLGESSNSWTGVTSYAELIASSPIGKQLILEFVSPTVFKKTDGRWLSVPEPYHIFQSLLQRWNTFAPILMPDDLLDEVTDCIVISSQDTRIRSLRIENDHPLKGFIGGVTLQIMSDNPLLIQYVNVLAQFAKYCGVGARTAVGFGQIRVI